jgi:hypothetical protein
MKKLRTLDRRGLICVEEIKVGLFAPAIRESTNSAGSRIECLMGSFN